MPDALTMLNQGPAGTMYADLLQKKIEGRDWDFYMYQASWLPLLASAPGTAAGIQIDSDADFLAVACVGVARTVAGVAIPDRPFLISARSSGTGADLFPPTDFDMVVGTAQQPAWWGLPRMMGRSSALVFTLQNLSATAYNVRVGFWGVKVYI